MATYTMTLKRIVESKINIFDFDYEMFDEEYKKEFEQLFIDYFFLDEIAHETIGQFKHQLKTKLKLIMPYYNKLYETQLLEQRILDNYSVTETYEREIKGENNTENKNMYKDTPLTKVNIEKMDVVSNINKNEGKTSNNAQEKWKRTMNGNIGVQTDSDAIVKYWQSLRNVTLEIFDHELSCLFMGIF